MFRGDRNKWKSISNISHSNSPFEKVQKPVRSGVEQKDSKLKKL